MTETPYDTEDVLQALIAKFPDLLAGDQLAGGSARRWLLIGREASLPSEEDGGGRWSVDHLFLDQDAVPTLVEVKRSSDTRIRREVVGQMLDYAANAVVYWPIEQLRLVFERRCESDGLDSEAVLEEVLAGGDVETFWEQAGANLKAGRVRLVFIADQIPRELRRVVEFLNEQMTADVIAIEVKQYIGEGVRTLVPRVIGETAATETRKIRREQRRQWDEESILREVQETSGKEAHEVARRFFRWAHDRQLVFQFGTGANVASFQPGLKDSRGYLFPVYLYSSGTFEIEFQTMESAPYYPFDSEAKRLELRRRLNAIPGLNVPDGRVRPNLQLSLFANPAVFDQFISVIDWTLEEARAWRAANEPPATWRQFSALPPTAG